MYVKFTYLQMEKSGKRKKRSNFSRKTLCDIQHFCIFWTSVGVRIFIIYQSFIDYWIFSCICFTFYLLEGVQGKRRREMKIVESENFSTLVRNKTYSLHKHLIIYNLRLVWDMFGYDFILFCPTSIVFNIK